MNSKKIILLGGVAACIFAASTATAQMRGHGGSVGGMGMRGGFMPHSMGGMGMHGAPMMNSPVGPTRFGHPNFNGRDRFGRFNRFDDGRFVRNHRFNHFHHVNNVVFIGDFGFPWWWGWGPAWSWGWGYPYGYYGYYAPPYGYSNSGGSGVAQLQRRLARSGYYHGRIDGIMGPATRRAMRAYERDRGHVS
jgi:hypothetical protein